MLAEMPASLIGSVRGSPETQHLEIELVLQPLHNVAQLTRAQVSVQGGSCGGSRRRSPTTSSPLRSGATTLNSAATRSRRAAALGATSVGMRRPAAANGLPCAPSMRNFTKFTRGQGMFYVK